MAVSASIENATAKDWIEKVRITKGGIDTKVISVRANSNGYTTTQSSRHAFKLSLYAKAKSGKRIGFAEVGRNNVSVHENDPAWTQFFSGRNINSGSKRTWIKEGSFNVPLNKITWSHGIHPVAACNNLLKRKIQRGQNKADVLNKVGMTEAIAHFGFTAAAARPGFAKKFNVGNPYKYTEETATYFYKVQVKCLPAATPGNQIQS